MPPLPADISLLHQTQTKQKMKASTILLATALTLSMNVLFASNDGAVMNRETTSNFTSLAPSTPTEAIFEEISDATNTIVLAPATPMEADFTDAVAESTINITTLAPVTPIEADFATDDETTNVSVLSPVTPSVADFSDGI